jgi:hypothetical protein
VAGIGLASVFVPVRPMVDGLSQLLTSMVRIALRPKAVQARSEVGFKDWFQHHLRGGLDLSISDRGDA